MSPSEYARQWRKLNKEKNSEIQKRYREKHKDRLKELKEKSRLKNLASHNNKEARRRASKLQRTPSWFKLRTKGQN